MYCVSTDYKDYSVDDGRIECPVRTDEPESKAGEQKWISHRPRSFREQPSALARECDIRHREEWRLSRGRHHSDLSTSHCHGGLHTEQLQCLSSGEQSQYSVLYTYYVIRILHQN